MSAVLGVCILIRKSTVATLLQAHPPGWAFECLGPNVQLELEPTRSGLIIQSERYPYRQSKWANPFNLKTLTREESLTRYEAHIRAMLAKDPNAKSELLGLAGKNLGCWCKPESCHADVLIKLINELSTLSVSDTSCST